MVLEERVALAKGKHIVKLLAARRNWPAAVKRDSNWSASMWSLQGPSPLKVACGKEGSEGMAKGLSVMLSRDAELY